MTEEEDQWEDARDSVLPGCERSTGMIKEKSQWEEASDSGISSSTVSSSNLGMRIGLQPQSHQHKPVSIYEMRSPSSTDSGIFSRSGCSRETPPDFNDKSTSEQRSETDSSHDEERGRCLYSSTYKCECNEYCAEMTHSAIHARPCPCCGGQREACCKAFSTHTNREKDPHNRKQDKSRLNEFIEQSVIKCKGPPTLYHLKPKGQIISEQPEIKRKTIGQKDTGKIQKTILMVGETGSGKSTLINTMISYLFGVNFEDEVWFDILGGEGKDETESQTKHITVYDVFVKDSSHSLTIIDTPGFGDTRGMEFDEMVSESLLNLCRMEDGVHEIDAVCLVVKASLNRLSERQHYIFNAVVSLFGRDIENNIVLLITHSSGAHPKALQAITGAKIPCALNKKNQPVHFKFDNWQEQTYNEDDEEDYKQAWKRGEKSMKDFLEYLKTMERRSLKMTEGVLRKRKQLKACFNNLLERVQWTDLKQVELGQRKDALEKFKKKEEDFEVEIDEVYKEKVPINPSWWHLSKAATCCTVCKENCHHPGCWWVKDLSWCSVMDKDGNCTVCTNKCDFTKHVKVGEMYVSKTRKVTIKKEDFWRELGEKQNAVRKLEAELKNAKEDKSRLVDKAYQSIITLEESALKPDSYSTLLYLDSLIDKIKETGDMEKYQRLIDIKRRAAEENR